ncbi:MAG: MMPL family transporter [Planctomycetota bacterium]|nr:MAG: MMPL family transporter [Planctomycetota bacterium]
MYNWCGKFVSRWPVGTLLAWVVILVVVITTAPTLQQVAKDGEFAFLPQQSPSILAEQAFREAFPTDKIPADAPPVEVTDNEGSQPTNEQAQLDPLGSSIVIVVQREHVQQGLTDADKLFVTKELESGLRTIQQKTAKGYKEEPLLPNAPLIPTSDRIIRGIWTFEDIRIGPLLQSEDEKSTLIRVELATEFLDRGNKLVVSRIEELIEQKRNVMPAGLDVALSGSATVGRDMLVAESESAAKTDHYTKVLVIILLLLIYRAPLMVLIPLVTVGVAVRVALHSLRILADWNIVGLFTGLDVYVTVVAYGSGVDFCLFLLARYKEELDRGASFKEAITLAVTQVGAALATSAGTSIVGIGMLHFTEFGKFQQAGVAISFGLFIALLCSLTLTPALILLFGRWTFWPDVRQERITASSSFIPASSFWTFLQQQRWLERGWEWVAELVSRRPGAVFVSTVLLLTPLALVGAIFKDHLSYGLLSDLPSDEPSVMGAKAVQKHFPPGAAGVTTFLVEHPQFDLTSPTDSARLSATLTASLMKRRSELAIADVRSQSSPHGLVVSERRLTFREKKLRNKAAYDAYCSHDPASPRKGKLMRLDIVFETDPFARDAITRLEDAELALAEAVAEHSAAERVRDSEQSTEALAEDTSEEEPSADAVPVVASPTTADYEFADQANIYTLGPTASIRDLKNSTDRDQTRINVYVSVAVFLVLMALLRQPALCAYLIITVIFSYLVTLGATFLVFRYSLGEDFVGLDWKVPVYLFTLLLALGEDYNVLFMSRVTEEQPKHGAVPGILLALTKTGGIISSCGVIMAGTFASLMTGTLAGMQQMGFALAFGVLVDTFVVRPILVPAYLVLLNNGSFGSLSQFLGAYKPQAPETGTPS